MKKAYETPELKVYGPVETLTKGFSDQGGNDLWGLHDLFEWFRDIFGQSQTTDPQGSGGGCGWN